MGRPLYIFRALVLGLGPADDLDALVVFEAGTLPSFGPGDSLLFSLAPGSATFTTIGSPYFGGSAATIYSYTSGGPPGVVHAAPASLGLAASDNVDALDVVPEPSTVLLASFGLLAVLVYRRKVLTNDAMAELLDQAGERLP